jgi:hypothetical protein
METPGPFVMFGEGLIVAEAVGVEGHADKLHTDWLGQYAGNAEKSGRWLLDVRTRARGENGAPRDPGRG